MMGEIKPGHDVIKGWVISAINFFLFFLTIYMTVTSHILLKNKSLNQRLFG